jgi:predicted amidophosphoribosyltransferase
MNCPNCKSKNLGKIGATQYYCWNCFIELSVCDGKLSLNQVEEDGSLTSLDDLFDDEEIRIEM